MKPVPAKAGSGNLPGIGAERLDATSYGEAGQSLQVLDFEPGTFCLFRVCVNNKKTL